MNYTYRQLLDTLKELTEEELDLTATIYDMTDDEYHQVSTVTKTDDDITLEHDHLVLIINDKSASIYRQSRHEGFTRE